MIRRFTAVFITQLCVITVLGFALNLNFCNNAVAADKCSGLVIPPGDKEVPSAIKKFADKQQADPKIKSIRQGETPSVISKLLSIELPKVSFGNFVLSAQKALIDKLSSDEPSLPPPPCGKTSQYIKNGILRNN